MAQPNGQCLEAAQRQAAFVGRDRQPHSRPSLAEALEKAGIKNVYFESPGTAHEWLTWRRSLNAFVPRLFQ